MSAANPNVTAIRQSVKQSYTDLQELLDGPVGTVYAAKLYQTPTENEWTIMENLAHIVEFMPYWGDEVAKLIAQPGQNFGRTMQHEGRQAALREHSHDTLVQARAALPASYAHLDEILSRLQDSDLELTGQHVKFGKRTLAWFIHDFITQHLHNHVVQIKECLDAIK
ncbi:MAG: DinB family protein [Ktedonobacteraceae bacterium]